MDNSVEITLKFKNDIITRKVGDCTAKDILHILLRDTPEKVDKYEEESFKRFSPIVPKNAVDWHGGIVLHSTSTSTFYNIAFGSGCNLDDEDIDNGYDDYIMVSSWTMDGSFDFDAIVDAIRENDGVVDENVHGLGEGDGGQLLLKRSEWKDGDIRRFIMHALEFAEYGDPTKTSCEDVLFICENND